VHQQRINGYVLYIRTVRTVAF